MEFSYKTKPFEHQRTALKKGALQKLYAYFMEMGTGKTKVTIDNSCYLYTQNKISSVIVIAPNSVYRNWIQEIDTHSGVENNINVHKQDKKFTYEADKLNWYLFNVEALSHDSGVKRVKDVVKHVGSKAMMVIDESTTIKNRSAKRTKNISQLGISCEYKRILTGSPITKSPLDLFSQCGFLSKSLLGYGSYFAFQSRYAEMQDIEMNGTFVTLPKYYKNLEELEFKLKSFSYRVKKEDCLDLPEKIYQKRFVELNKDQLKSYEDLKERARTIIEDEKVSYANKLTEILRLHQITNGFVKSNEGTVIEYKNPKLKELLNILEETSGKVIIWANYVHNIESIIQDLQKRFGKQSTVAIYGAISTEKRVEAVEKFQTNPNVRFFVGNPSTGGYGLTLTKAQTVIYYSNSYNLEVRQQSEDRAHRIGQTKNVTYIDIVARGTIDEMILAALEKKIKISAKTLGETVKKWI
jgi:SNF2 family DNA or RNA helicase|tara:strand:+ start:226 stop:1626 length:1401 start_codon:yes stop_codon:yes gene_type:complete